MTRMYSPSPTVRSSAIPFYMKGWPRVFLGQDDGSIVPIDTTMYDPGNDLVPPPEGMLPSWQMPDVPASMLQPTTYDPSGNLIAPAALDPQTAALAQLYQSSVAAGTMTQAQAASAIAQLTTGAAAVAKAAAGVATAPAPRVTLPAVATAPNILTAATVIPGVPNWTLLAVAAVAALAMGSK